MIYEPFLSIIIPVYNVEKFINQCLDSLFKQDSYANEYEIIIVNDGSLDNSMEIVDLYSRKQSNIIRIDKKNGGVSSARNVGIEVSKGKYLLFVDPDDSIEENTLGKIVSQLNNCSVEILILNSHEYDCEGKERKENYKYPKKLCGKTLTGIQLFQNGYVRGSVCGVAFKRQFIMDNNLRFPEGILNGEDSLFMSKCFVYSTYVSNFDLNFYKVYRRIESASQSWNYQKVKVMLANLSIIKDFQKKGSFNARQNAIMYTSAYIIISNLLFNFFSIHRLDKYHEIKHAIKESGLYPIPVYAIKKFKTKISLLNFSFDLFCIPFLIRQLINDFKRMIAK